MSGSCCFAIPADHPALAGHFPGNPIVPGSMILEQVAAARGADCSGFPQVKFHQPLRPAQKVIVSFSDCSSMDSVDFECECAGERIASGRMRIATAT